MKITILLLTLLPAVVLGAFNQNSICGGAINRCRRDPDCNSDMRRARNMCKGPDLNCRRCGLAMAAMAGNRDGISVLLCVSHFGKTRARIENFLQQCTNTERTPPPFFTRPV